MSCAKKKKRPPEPGGYRCKKCGYGHKKKKKICKPEKLPR